jgi:hypothetical protein
MFSCHPYGFRCDLYDCDEHALTPGARECDAGRALVPGLRAPRHSGPVHVDFKWLQGLEAARRCFGVPVSTQRALHARQAQCCRTATVCGGSAGRGYNARAPLPFHITRQAMLRVQQRTLISVPSACRCTAWRRPSRGPRPRTKGKHEVAAGPTTAVAAANVSCGNRSLLFILAFPHLHGQWRFEEQRPVVVTALGRCADAAAATLRLPNGATPPLPVTGPQH